MGLLEELYEIKNQPNGIVEQIKQQIYTNKKFLKENKIAQYNIVYIDFGDKLSENYTNNQIIQRDVNETFSIKEMFNKKGLNCGYNEFRYSHMAVILEPIHHKYLLTKNDKHFSILVAPISSKRHKDSIKIESKYHIFLDRDSYILMDNITNISLEKINIKLTNSIFQKNNRKYPKVSIPIIQQIHKSIKERFKI